MCGGGALRRTISASVDKKLIVGLLKDWGLALGVTVAVFVAWNMLNPGPPSSGGAPDFELRDLEGNTVTLSDLAGEVVVLNFWATWCGPCRQEIPDLAAFHKENPDIPLVGVSVDDLSTGQLARKAKELGVNYTVLHDRDATASNAYAVSGLPTTFVLDAQGEIVAVKTGAVSRRRLEKMVQPTISRK